MRTRLTFCSLLISHQYRSSFGCVGLTLAYVCDSIRWQILTVLLKRQVAMVILFLEWINIFIHNANKIDNVYRYSHCIIGCDNFFLSHIFLTCTLRHMFFPPDYYVSSDKKRNDDENGSFHSESFVLFLLITINTIYL